MQNHEIKIFPKIQTNSDSLKNSLQNNTKFVWFTCFFQKWLVEVRPAPPHPFILKNYVYKAAKKGKYPGGLTWVQIV